MQKKRIKTLFKYRKRVMAGFLAVILVISGVRIPEISLASDVWPQKVTAPYYCLDGGKIWKSADQYELYEYDTLPSALTEIQAKRLFWAYPSNWNALKEAAKVYDSELYSEIAATVSGPNVVKRVKDDGSSKYAWVADNPEIEKRAISALERELEETSEKGKEAPGEFRNATSEEEAVMVMLPAFGPGALDTKLELDAEFVKDIANIEAQSVWDNGSGGRDARWVDVTLQKNSAGGMLGNQLYEITWKDDSIMIHNNGSAAVSEYTAGSNGPGEEKYNKTKVRYKITMRENSGWNSSGKWDEDYLREWMEFKACANDPGHQRLYKANIKLVPSDAAFYMIIDQKQSDGDSYPEYGNTDSDVSFQVYKHEEKFQAHYHVKLKKIDDETENPLKGSQFYLYERFEDKELLSESEENGGLAEERLNFVPWEGYQIFSEGITDENGEITHTDVRTYQYSKTYCDGHGMPDWASVEDGETEEESEDAENEAKESAQAEAKDQNIAAAEQWMQLYRECEEMEENSKGTHFHWLMDDEIYEAVEEVLETGVPEWEDGPKAKTAAEAFEQSGCKQDCEETYENFINLRFAYTWKEIQARNGYVLHGIHQDDVPIEAVVTNSSEAGAESVRLNENSEEIKEHIWYGGEAQKSQKSADAISAAVLEKRSVQILAASSSNAEDAGIKMIQIATESDARLITRRSREWTDDTWEESAVSETFDSYYESAELDEISHLALGNQTLFSYPESAEKGRDFWLIRNHRTEGEIYVNKKDKALFKGESDTYSAYGDTEGDSSLAGAVYGLFAAEDIIHPDSELAENGSFTNTGIVYKKHDLVAVAVTDEDGNVSFQTYTEKPGMHYNYETQGIETREDLEWSGPENRYEENNIIHGNWWIGRPLILGNYYIKELSRSEGYELSVNGKSKLWTNYDESFDTPEGIASAEGNAMVFIADEMVSMEGEGSIGNGYDQIPFRVMSRGTSGYKVTVSGLPKGVEFYRVDAGETEVTGPRVTGTERVVVRDDNGEVLWKKADKNQQYLKYRPEYDDAGNLIGQTPVTQSEWQILKDQQVPAARLMEITDYDVDLSDARWSQTLRISEIKEQGADFGLLKAELEKVLRENGYETPTTYDGLYSQSDRPVYSAGVKKGQTDLFGMTVQAGEPALKTVYGAAITEILLEDVDGDSSLYDLYEGLLKWYMENPQWSFGGLHAIKVTEEGYVAVLYAGASTSGNRRFFTLDSESEEMEVDKVYTVIENPYELRWEYQEYTRNGQYQFEVTRQYFYGSGNEKRYYIDVSLSPAVMVDVNGEIQPLEHTVMVYHEEGEEIVDYILGDPAYDYRVPQTTETERIEITSELEYAEQDVYIEHVTYDEKNGQYEFFVEMDIYNSFGEFLTDKETSLELCFMAKLPQTTVVLSEADVEQFKNRTIRTYQSGDEIGYGEYLMMRGDLAIGISNETYENLEDTYIAAKALRYRSQYKVLEDGDTRDVPVQVLERPIVQKVQVVKETENGEAVGNFQFKIYLKSNLETLYCDKDGTIVWLDRCGNTVDISEYKKPFPALVQKIYTRKTDRKILESQEERVQNEDGSYVVKTTYNYRKFFDAVKTANLDKWENTGGSLKNTSSKPFTQALYSGKTNEINTSNAAKENAKRSDAVRQFAVTWYLKEKVQGLTKEIPELGGLQVEDGTVSYSDEVYDQALYEAILDAEVYLQPFFQYDLDTVYEIMWDSEFVGGSDMDLSTLEAGKFEMTTLNKGYTYGVSKYLPYGDYVVVEQQPQKEDKNNLINRHYQIDVPKELSLPQYSEGSDVFMKASDVPWSVTEPGEKKEMSGYAVVHMMNQRYRAVIRIEKNDVETGEPILHDDSIFGLYRAERADGEKGGIKRYTEKTLLSGSKWFLEAMGAEQITSFARDGIGGVESADRAEGAGIMYWGYVPAGTPICKEEDCVIFTDMNGKQQGMFQNLSSAVDREEINRLQNVGYIETPEPVEAGVYVLAELKAPSGYTRSGPIAVEILSDDIQYGKTQGVSVSAVKYGGEDSDILAETARIYVSDTATSLEVEKKKTPDSYRGMKVSGRVEGSKTALDFMYGLENLELAYNSAGTYLGFGWKKGTLEYLENRMLAGEDLELVYENGVFQGYGYVRRTLETSTHKNPYAAGAKLALFDAIEIQRSGDSEDYAFKGMDVERDRSGTVISIKVREGYAGETEELVRSETGTWKVETKKREDTEVLFYDLHDLKVLEKTSDGVLYGFDRNGQKAKITFDTESIYAIRNGKAEFELCGGDFSKLKYDVIAGIFANLDADTKIYHLDEDFCRDAQVDGYTGLAYVEKAGNVDAQVSTIFVWPVREIKNRLGNVISKEKILTGRPGEVNAGTENAYITGSVGTDGKTLEKEMNPVYDLYGMVKYYPEAEAAYKKGEDLYDRDGMYIGYRTEDLLNDYNRAAYGILDPLELYGSDREKDAAASPDLKYRKGEAWIIPNIWITGNVYPQDPSSTEITDGQKDLLRRVVPGTYIMEELSAPEGYARSMPVAVTVEDTADLQNVSMVNERIKVEIAKIDGTDQYKKKILQDTGDSQEEWSVEEKGAYSGEMILGAKLALYKAERVYTSDYSTYPKGYYFVKKENTPAKWSAGNGDESSNGLVEAVWITDGQTKYFEGIPAGDYILEEMETPKGYLPASMEITVNPTEELQSFILKDDHIKVEVYKYERDRDDTRIPLQWPAEAELTLYPAELDAQGNAIKENGEYVYQKIPTAQWTTGKPEEYKEQLCREYELMYAINDCNFETFAWQWGQGTELKNGYAKLESTKSTTNGEKMTQLWRLEDQSLLRVTVEKDGRTTPLRDWGKINAAFEYEFDYKECENAQIPDMVSYELTNGIRRIDRIPAGTYILVETKVPDGYHAAEPVLIEIKETDSIQRFLMENKKEEVEKKGTLIIEKRDAEQEEKKLAGTMFEVKNLQSGAVFFLETNEQGQAVLSDLPLEGIYDNGVEGKCIYQIREVAAPEGYRFNKTIKSVSLLDHGTEELVYRHIVTDEKTRFCFQKGDFSTGHFVPGATLSIYETKIEQGTYAACGEPVETWISGEETHIIEGKLSCGKTYLLVEEDAPEGYVIAAPIRFTVSADGSNLTDISENLTQISVAYEEGTQRIASLSIMGQAAKNTVYILRNSAGEELRAKGNGQPVLWNQKIESSETQWKAADGEILVAEEYVEFWDGSRTCLERDHFCMNRDSYKEPISAGRYPSATEYVLKNEQGVRIDAWSIPGGTYCHTLENLMNEDGEYRFQIGENYILEQIVTFDDGNRQVMQALSFGIETSGVVSVEILNRETRLEIRKTDITTGRELPGAVLAVKDEHGAILEQWVSLEEEHVMEGMLLPGKRYVLSEILAADGYAYAKEIPFTIQKDGCVEKITMEDRLTEVHILKTDQATGDELPGAVMAIKNSDGEILEQWVSGKMAHVIRGNLTAGKTYRLEELKAPYGYCLSEPIEFTVSIDGSLDRILMENHRTSVEKEMTEEEAQPKKDGAYGVITAKYEMTITGDGVLRIKIPENGKITTIPKTGDEPFPWGVVLTAGLSLLGCLVLLMAGRKNDDE